MYLMRAKKETQQRENGTYAFNLVLACNVVCIFFYAVVNFYIKLSKPRVNLVCLRGFGLASDVILAI